MRTLPTAKPSRIARPILFTLAIFAALTLLGVISRPTVHVAAQSAADSTQTPNVYRPKFNYTGDSKSDFVMIANPGPAGSAITWKVLRNPGIPGPNNAFIRIFSYGLNGDALNPADFNNDGISEVSVWRSGTSYSAPFPEGTAGFSNLNVINWGNPTGENLGRDGDYDGDGIIDLTTVRFGADRKLTWVYRGTAGTNRQVQFGKNHKFL